MIKNYYFQHLRTLIPKVLLTLLASLSMGAYAQLSGNKTLGSGGDYTSWSALASDIKTKGVSGTLNVTVTSNLTITSIVTLENNGTNPTSSTKQITIDGKGFKLSSSNNDAAIIFDGIDYVTLKITPSKRQVQIPTKKDFSSREEQATTRLMVVPSSIPA